MEPEIQLCSSSLFPCQSKKDDRKKSKLGVSFGGAPSIGTNQTSDVELEMRRGKRTGASMSKLSGGSNWIGEVDAELGFPSSVKQNEPQGPHVNKLVLTSERAGQQKRHYF